MQLVDSIFLKVINNAVMDQLDSRTLLLTQLFLEDVDLSPPIEDIILCL